MKKTRILLSIYLFFLSFTVYSQTEQKRLALVIGNSAYTRAGALKLLAKDASTIANLLGNCEFRVIPAIDCNKEQLNVKISEFLSEITNYDVALLYYSGHSLNYSGISYIVPVDADIKKVEDINDNCYIYDSLIIKMEQAKLKFNLIFLDVYRPNTFRFPGIVDVGFVVKAPPNNFLIYNSAVPQALACDCSSISGLFTERFIKYLQEPDLEITDFVKVIFRDVYQLSQKHQKGFYLNNLNEKFYFRKN